ncbi:hypothetical protein BBJ28_00004576 [Nothophytophthora sp. Chile5]|nr:hypothetical protein BBJ28_00004576 [Nothophytophthora sp. Chile5]
MGVRHSALKKELETLKRETRKTAAKHKEELETAVSEKRLLQQKLDEAQQHSKVDADAEPRKAANNACSPNQIAQPDAKEEKEVEIEVAVMSPESGSDSERSDEDSSSKSAPKMSRSKFIDDAASSKSEKLTTPSRVEVTTDAKPHDDSENKEGSSPEPDDVLTFSDDEETSS